MSDRTKSTPPEPDRPVTANVGPELQPRCRAEVGGARCSRPEGHDAEHRAADLPEPPECADPDRPAWMPDVEHCYEAAGVLLRATYRVAVRESDARRLEQLAEELAEDDESAVPAPYLRFIQAAAVDLMNIAAFLDYVADDRGDGVERHDIPVAAVVLETYPEVERLAERLMAAVSAAEGERR